jgi:hypothetical protein
MNWSLFCLGSLAFIFMFLIVGLLGLIHQDLEKLIELLNWNKLNGHNKN